MGTDADGGVEVARNIAVVVAAIFGLLILARIVRAYSRRLFRRVPNLSKLLQSFLAMVLLEQDGIVYEAWVPAL